MSDEEHRYTRGEDIRRTAGTTVFAATLDRTGRRVILKAGGAEATVSLIDRLRHEHGLISRFASDDVVKAVALLPTSPDGPLLMLEDIGGITLSEWVQDYRPALADRLEAAAAAARGLAHVHAAGALHGDISADNIVVNPADRRVNIIDFGGAVALPPGASIAADAMPAVVDLSAVAPERTGRMNRPVDHRADLYSLGAVLYQLFTGRPPFEGAEEIELLHAHLAKRPAPLQAIAPEIPAILSEIVQTLLMKQAEERYRSAADLAADLERCRAALAATGRIAPFALKAGGGAMPFESDPTLHGRAAPLAALRDAVATAAAGHTVFVHIGGAAGIGKSALAHGIRDAVAEAGGRFAVGKFEQQQRDMPYLGLARSFDALVRGVLTEPDERVAAWREALTAALGRNAGALVALVPVLGQLIGPQPALPALAPVEARHRLGQLVKDFVAVFAAPQHPLVLVLDDLQWADQASGELLAPICSAAASGGLLLIATCRDEASDDGVALPDILAIVADHVADRRDIALEALEPADIGAMLAGVAGATPGQAAAAAALIHAKTLGNPLFVRQLLKHLWDTGAIGAAGGWNLDRIAQVEATDNVVGFLAGRIGHLPPAVQRPITAAACLGMQIDTGVLGRILELEDAALRRALDAAVSDGMLVVRDGEYGFAHDRIREAAHQLATDRCAIHRRIGLHLLDTTRPEDLPAAAFTIALHLNGAGDPGDDPEFRARCAAINLLAARRARAAAALGPARDYAETGMRLIDPALWQTGPDEIAEAALLLAECRVLTQDHAGFEAAFDDLLGRLRDDERRLRLHLLKVLSLDAQALYAQAISAGLTALRLADIDLPATQEAQRAAVGAEFEAFQALMAGRPAEALLDLPRLADGRLAGAMQLLFRLAPDAHDSLQPELFALMALRNANLMLRHGHDSLAPGIVITLALTLRGLTGDTALADSFAQVAITLDERLGHPLTASVTFVYTYFLQHWLHPLGNALQLNLDGIRAGFEMGDMQFGSYHAATYAIHLLCDGGALAEVARIGTDHLRLIGRHNRTAYNHCRIQVEFAEALMGQTAAPTALSHERAPSVAEELAHVATLDVPERAYYLVRKLQLALLFRDLGPALTYAEALPQALPAVAGNFIEAEGTTFLLLATLAVGATQTPDFTAARVRLQGWSVLNPHNFGHMHSLVEAELARVEGRAADALHLYGDAIRGAEAGKFVHYTALANECAGRFCLGLGNEVAATAHLREAATLYGYWGAAAKRMAIEAEFPRLVVRPLRGRSSQIDSTSVSTEESLDFRAALRAARSISREIDLQRLLHMVLAAIQESAGAAYGVLVLRRDDGLHVEAIGRHGDIATSSGQDSSRLEHSRAVPQSILSYVLRTREALVLDNAQHSPEFSTDPYIRSQRVVSVLCAPLDERGQVDGLVYLENNLAAGVFSPRRLEIVHVLAAQAAIALANARLFAALDTARTDLLRANEGLEQKVAERTTELAEARNRAVAKEREARRAKRAAETANQAKSRFLAVVSHEIRTPMNGVLGMLQILDRDRLQGEQRRYLEIAEESGRSLLELIDGILDYARLENDQEALDLRDFDLHRLVGDTVELIRPQAAAKGLVLALAIDAPPDIILHSDPRRLGRVLINLLGNAVKFTPQGRIAISVALEPGAAKPGQVLRLTVQDTGIGIAPEMHERVFGDFVQADTSIARHYGGTGLGLAICRRIAGLLGGTLTLESDTGVGSTFRLTVPVALGTAMPEAPAPVAAGPALSVLVVDDDPINRAVAAGLLGRLGHRVALADSGQAGIEAAAATAFDVVMMDLHMPGMDGLEATRRIRALPGERSQVQILALTADLTDGSRQRCALAGIERILGKPLQLDALRRMLAAVSDADRPADPPAPVVESTALVDDDFFAERYEILGVTELARLALMFHRISRPMIQAIEAAAASGDRPALARLAHRMSSSAGAIGLVQLARGASAIERRAGEEAPVDTLVEMAASLLPLRRASLQALFAQMRAAQRPFENAAGAAV